jgi:kinesin family protein 6/9
VSYFEIYNDYLSDLLLSVASSASSQYSSDPFSGPSGSASSIYSTDLTIIEDKTGQTVIRNLSRPIVSSEEEALNYLFEGETNRSIAEHQMNKTSSRSHCIFTIYFELRSKIDPSAGIIISKLNLVDLAGSERVGKTGTSGNLLVEANNINRSLTYLEQVSFSFFCVFVVCNINYFF